MYSATLHIKLFFATTLLLIATSINAQNFGSVSGTIKSSSGEHLPAVNILLQGNSHGISSNENGNYSLPNIPSGKYMIQASYMGFENYSAEITITANKNTTHNIVLEEKNIKIKDIQVNGKSTTTKINEQAYTVTSVSSKGLLNSTASAKDALKKISGIRISEDGGLGSTMNFSMNGFSGAQVKFFMDGLPIDNSGGAFNIGDLPVNMIERIDVYNGVVPVWLGSDALGGAVNIVTNKQLNYTDISYSFGSFNTHKASINTAHTNTDNGFTVRANAFGNYSDNNYKVYVPIRDGNNQLLYYKDTKRFHDRYRSAGLKLEAGVVKKSYADELLLGLMASANDNEIQHGATMETVYGGIVRNSRSITPSVRYSKQNFILPNLDINLFSSLNIQEQEVIDTLRGVTYNWLGEAFYSNNDDGELSRTNTKLNDILSSTQFNSTYHFNKEQSVAFNYAYSYFNRDSYDSEWPDKIENSMPKSLHKHIGGLSYQFENHKWNATVFGKFYALTANTSKLFDYALSTERTEAITTHSQNFGYGAAAAYFITPTLQAKASYEHTYRLPSADEIFGNGLTVDPNPDLGPEQSNNFNLGLNYHFRINEYHHLNIGGSFIYRQAKDLIYTVVQVANPITYYENLSNTKTTGVEANIKYQWKDIFSLSANLTYQDITDQTKFIFNNSYSGNNYQTNYHYGYRLPNTPYLFGNLNAGLTFKDFAYSSDCLSFNYLISYTKEYYLTWSKNDKYIIPKQMAHNVELSYSLKNGKYNISANCSNIFNSRLYDKFYLQKPGRAFYIKLRYTL